MKKVLLVIGAIWCLLLVFGIINMQSNAEETSPDTNNNTVQQKEPSADSGAQSEKQEESQPSTPESKGAFSAEKLQDLKALASEQTTFWHRAWSLLGLLILLGLGFLLSENKKAIDWRLVLFGMIIQLIMGILILRTVPGRWVFARLADGVQLLLDFSNFGADFVFGSWPNAMQVTDAVTGKPWILGYNFAVKVLPTIIFVSAVFSLLYHWGILQRLVDLLARIMMKFMKISGAESLCAAANVFMGMTQAPLIVEPYVQKMTRSEMMVLMTSGMATLGSGVLAAYIGMGIDATHILTASFINAPASIVIAKMMIPETETPLTRGKLADMSVTNYSNAFDATAAGAAEGMSLSISIAAMLIAFLGLIALINAVLGFTGEGIGYAISNPNYTISSLSGLLDKDGNFPLRLETLLGIIGSPIALVIGISPSEMFSVGGLIGLKTAANEFIAYSKLAELIKSDTISARSAILSTYALCGFANLGSIGVLIGGVAVIAPSRRGDMAKLGIRSLIGGSLASFLAATIAGILM